MPEEMSLEAQADELGRAMVAFIVRCQRELDSCLPARESIPAAYAAVSGVLAPLLAAKRLNAMPYEGYLRTRHWQSKRWEALARARGKCERCEASGVVLDVHHLTYKRRGREEQDDLLVLCRDCHDKEHGKTYAEKLAGGVGRTEAK